MALLSGEGFLYVFFRFHFRFAIVTADLLLRFLNVAVDFNPVPRVFPAEIGEGKNPRARGCVV